MQDLRFALRNLLKHPAFATVAVTTIALGMGAVTALFSVVNSVLLRDLPFEDPSRLVRIWSSNDERGLEREFMSPPDIADYQSQNQTFLDMAAYSEAELALIDRDGSAVKVVGTWAGDNLFSVLGVQPRLGRGLLPEDGAPGAAKVVLIGNDFWQESYGGDRSAVGQSLVLEGESYTIIGVMPPGFDFPGRSNLWLNRHLLAYPGRYARWMDVVGRLAPGVEVGTARSDLASIAQRLEEEYPEWNRAYGITMLPLHEAVVGETRSSLVLLFGASGLLLLIACVNVVNLMLARLADRGREVAVRTALGAGRRRLSRQMLTESMVLAAAGAMVGTLLASFGIDLLTALGPNDLPRLDEVRVDGGVLLFAFLITVGTGLLFGLAAVLKLTRTDIRSGLQEGSRGSTLGLGRERIRSLLVVAEIGLAVMLVVGAGLLSRSFGRLLETDPGFDTANVLTLQVDLPTTSYPEYPAVADYHLTLTNRLGALPGVESVAATAALPFDAELPFLGNFLIAGQDAPDEGEEPRAHYRQITAGYFSTMGIELIDGRDFEVGDDRESHGVAVINQALVRRYFPDSSPLGETISGLPPHLALGGFLVEGFEIVGVVEDVKYFGLAEDAEPSLYLPVAQAPFRRMSFTLRTRVAPEEVVSTVREEIVALDPSVPISRVRTMDQILAASVSRERFSTVLLTVFAAVALVLAAVGIYGVISYSMSQRTSEMGVRMAVGADPRDVVALVMAHGAKLTILGLGTGLLGAVALRKVMAAQLYGISATDPSTFLGVAVILGVVAMTATLLPAVRTSRVDPVLALQGDRR